MSKQNAKHKITIKLFLIYSQMHVKYTLQSASSNTV